MPATTPNIAELVARMPDVDPPKKPEPRKQKEPDATAGDQTPKPPPPPEPPPDPNRPGKFTGPDPAVAERIFTEILSGGRDALTELLGMVRAPSDPAFQNYKAGYLLHALAIYVGEARRKQQRRSLANALARALKSGVHSKAAKAFFIQELQVVGAAENAAALGELLVDDDLNEPATRALLAIRDGAARQFRAALAKTNGRNRLNIIQALGVIRDNSSVAVLKKALSEDDREVRLAAAWSLANIAETSAADALLAVSDKAEGWERIQLTKSCLLLAEKLRTAGKKSDAARIFSHLRNNRTDDSERYVREAAEAAS